MVPRGRYVIAFQELDVNYSHRGDPAYYGPSLAERLQRVLGDEYALSCPLPLWPRGMPSSSHRPWL